MMTATRMTTSSAVSVKGRRGVRGGRPFVRIGRATPSTPVVIVLKVAGGRMLRARGRGVVLVGKA